MKCNQAKQNIALLAGNDLDPMSVRELRRHLKECRGCVEQWQRMKASVETLQNNCPGTGPIEDSVWPEIVIRLPKHRTVRHRPDRFNGWAPTLAVVAACGLMLMIARWNVPAGGNAGGRLGASGDVPASQFNSVFSPDMSAAYYQEFTPSPTPVVDRNSPYHELFSGAYQEVDAASSSNGNRRGGLKKHSLSNRK